MFESRPSSHGSLNVLGVKQPPPQTFLFFQLRLQQQIIMPHFGVPVLDVPAVCGDNTLPSHPLMAKCFRDSGTSRSGGRSLGTVLDEEEERRKRRREKNKVAAARCRNKKKERTEFLQRESERLELMNAELKTQIEELKQERQQLILMLNRHRPTCIVRTDSVKTPESEGNPLLEQLEKK
ncbi:jun dimerization protein 2 isoform X1 [Neofelis nebulosa]|uniref:jun dimerization protein 2 isoform X1 n=1 Tax=Neofelis nebulosa TaxID=61452 RepID=UPI00272D0D76|nr:jun dimerization protein 2 isoform X1 [Neofelis nebulosa]